MTKHIVHITDRFGRVTSYEFTKREYELALPDLLEEMLYRQCKYTVEVEGEMKELDYYNIYKKQGGCKCGH